MITVGDVARDTPRACFSFCRTHPEISGGEYGFPAAPMRTSPLPARSTEYGTIFISSETSSNLRPMNRLIEKTVFSGLVTACRLATWPTRRSPDLVNPTTDGVMRLPSGLVITTGSPPSITATTELVVPRSIPIILDISSYLAITTPVGSDELYNVNSIKCARHHVKLKTRSFCNLVL